MYSCETRSQYITTQCGLPNMINSGYALAIKQDLHPSMTRCFICSLYFSPLLQLIERYWVGQKCFLGFFHTILWNNSNEFFGQPNRKLPSWLETEAELEIEPRSLTSFCYSFSQNYGTVCFSSSLSHCSSHLWLLFTPELHRKDSGSQKHRIVKAKSPWIFNSLYSWNTREGYFSSLRELFRTHYESVTERRYSYLSQILLTVF